MGRASFGGAGDYSGLFASLYNQSEAEAKRATEAAATRSKQALAAADDLAFSDWESGKISDDDLLAYIERRISESTTDPAELARWTKIQDDFRVRIADSKAEAAFAAGGDLADLVQYYETKMNSLQEGSAGYRVAQQRVVQLRDQAAEERFNNELNGLIERRASSQDLLDFYGKWKSLARPGSSLESKVENAYAEKKSQSVVETAEAKMAQLQFDFTRGKVSAAKYYAGIKDAASVYQTTDPVRYYQILQGAFKTKQAGTGGGGAAAMTDTLNSIIKLVDQWEASQVNGSATMFNPLTGQVETITADAIKKYDNQFIKSATNMASAYKAGGNNTQAAAIYSKIGSYIASHVQVHVGFEQTDRLTLLMNNGLASLQNALDSNNVYAPEKVAQELRGQISTWAKGLSYKPLEAGQTEADPYGPRKLPTQEILDWAAQADLALNIFSDPLSTPAQKSAAIDMISQSLSQPNVDPRLSAVVRDISDTFIKEILIPTGDITIVTDALKSGRATELYDANSGKVSVAFIEKQQTMRGEKAPDGTITMKPVLTDVLVDGQGNQLVGGGQIMANVLIDVDDQVKKMPVILSPSSLPIYTAVYATGSKKGKAVETSELQNAKEEDFLKGGKYRLDPPSVKSYGMIDVKTGKTWYYLPEINGQPGGWIEMDQVKVGANAIQIGQFTIVPQGQSGFEIPPYTKILPAPYIGNNPEGAQNYLNNDPDLRSGIVKTGADGSISPSTDPTGIYYSASKYGKMGTTPRDQLNARDSWWNSQTEEEIRRDKVREYNNSIIQFRAGEREPLGIAEPSAGLPIGIGVGAGFPTLVDAARQIGISLPPSRPGAPTAMPAGISEYAGINRAAAVAAQAKAKALTPTIKPATPTSDYLINLANANAAKAKFTVPNTATTQPTPALGGGLLPYARPATGVTSETESQRIARLKAEQTSLIQFRAGERVK